MAWFPVRLEAMIRTLWRVVGRWLVIGHRWLGISACLLFAMWFASGLVMAYVPYPDIGRADYLTLLEPMRWSDVKTPPGAVLDSSEPFPAEMRLEMRAGVPVYRIREANGRIATISAADGSITPVAGPQGALDIVRRAGLSARPRWAETLERDQWTVSGEFNAHRPLHKIALDDSAGTYVYVSSETGEIVQRTSRAQRFWNWLGAIPHWLYFTPLRADPALWRQVVLWTSGIGIFGAASGLWLGILRMRLLRRRRYAGGTISPYRGWMKWHHVAGLLGGTFVLTWTFSGWFSVDPFPSLYDGGAPMRPALTRYAGHDEASFDIALDAFAKDGTASARQARFVWVGGRPLVILADVQPRETVRDPLTAAPVTLAEEDILAAARHLLPENRMILSERITREDAYWHSHLGERPLPVLRVGFDDPAHSWFHIDPVTGAIVGRLDDGSRINRWLFSFLHDFDLPVLTLNRPLWDILIWGLSALGLITSISGIVIGWRRLKRKFGARAMEP